MEEFVVPSPEPRRRGRGVCERCAALIRRVMAMQTEAIRKPVRFRIPPRTALMARCPADQQKPGWILIGTNGGKQGVTYTAAPPGSRPRERERPLRGREAGLPSNHSKQMGGNPCTRSRATPSRRCEIRPRSTEGQHSPTNRSTGLEI